ncbi:Thioredoxin-like fold [Pseudocohnilembus persalinus]|uniref:Thioredoxin-like fold n=1 Tax=Pseudocohnilembus persalinus TaxID=266149 RepID=A0A0V0QVN8_PSEPJ|nr:Thioredoxin-like fold [Pseudocohnilembus persalinus]|eukprot:KRX06327.1 Thioredoxin-like fold [Pseudocohnilembus persalinus]
MNQEPIKFYSFLTCPYAIRTRIALEELKIPYIYEEIDLLTNQHLSENYIKINPMHKVPALILPNQEIIFESLVCCEFLDKDNLLTFNDKLMKAKIDIWIKFYEFEITSRKWKLFRCIKHNQKEKALKILSELIQKLSTLAQASGLTFQIQEKIEKINFQNQNENKLSLNSPETIINLVKNKKINNNFYFINDQFSLADVALLPLLIQDRIIFKFLIQTDILKQNNNQIQTQTQNQNQNHFNENFKDKEQIKNFQVENNLAALQIWLECASLRESVQNSTYKIKKLPSFDKQPLLQILNMNCVEKWDFEKFYTEFALRKFLGGNKPSL